MKKIVMVDLHNQYFRIKSEIDGAIQSVLDSTAFIQGPAVKNFEQEFSGIHDGAHTVSCANGTDALQIAMMALGFKPGDEIILPVFTYVATAEVIALLGLRPVFVDVEEKSFNIDPAAIQSVITPRTVAIVPVHLFGQCAAMEQILTIAKPKGIHVIEDYAQAIGARYTFANGTSRIAGTMGDIGCTSFFPSKNLGCYGDGGAMVTRDKALADRLRMVANHGQRKKYHHDLIGVNSRLDTLQAAILSVKLKYLNEYEGKRRSVADYYDRHLSELSFADLPARSKNSTHVFHQYTLRLKNTSRAEFKKYLEDREIPSMIYYPLPLHFQKAFAMDGFGKGSFPVSEKLSESVISLPIHTEMTEEQLSYICDIVKKYPG